MADKVFQVVFSGKTCDGTSKEDAQKKLAHLFKKDLAWSERLFSGQTITIKSTKDLKEALKYVRALKQCGAECEVVHQPARPVEEAGQEVNKPQQQSLSKTEMIRRAFTGEISPLVPSLSYRLSVVLVSMAMILLPALYLAFSGFIGYGTYRFAVSTEVLQTMRHGSWMGLVAYIGIIAGGVITVLVMLKPLFSRFADDMPRFSLSRLQQQAFFDLVDQIAEKVGAPEPADIVLDGNLNASASLIGGAIYKRELRLTVGLPLIRVMSANQLAGVIAHELGHFSQTTGMGLANLISRINYWFYLSATGGDPWDYKLAEYFKNAKQGRSSDHEFVNQVLVILLFVIQSCLWLSRKINVVFWKTGEMISGSISRQMEFDADRYEIHLVGSKVFRESSLLFSVAGVAYQKACDAFSYVTGSDNQLVDDFPKLTEIMMGQLSEDTVKAVHEAELSVETGLFDSHPSVKDRIDQAMSEDAAGIFTLDYDSTWLFKDFEDLSKKYTLWHYRNMMDLRFDRSCLIDADKLFEKDMQTSKEWDAMREHELSNFPDFFPLPLSAAQFHQQPDSAPAVNMIQTQMKQNAEKLESLGGRTKLACKRYEKKEERLFDLKYALFLTGVGIEVDAKSFGLRNSEEGTIWQTIEKVEHELEEVKKELSLAADVHASDILLTAQLFQATPSATEQLAEMNILLESFTILEKCKVDIEALWNDKLLLSNISDGLDDDDFGAILTSKSEQLYEENGRRLRAMCKLLGQVPYPFDYGGSKQRTLASYVFGSPASFGHMEEIRQHMDEVPSKYFALRGRVLARILQLKAEAE